MQSRKTQFFQIIKNTYLVPQCFEKSKLIFPKSFTNPNSDIFLRAKMVSLFWVSLSTAKNNLQSEYIGLRI